MTFIAGTIVGAVVAWAIARACYNRRAKVTLATYNQTLRHYAQTTGRVTVIQLEEP